MGSNLFPDSGTTTLTAFDLRYPGQTEDVESGLFYNHNRFYDPVNGGRYIQADPIGLAGGWNPYAYSGSDAVNNFDSDGLNFVSMANWAAMRAQLAYYRYGPAIAEFIAGASGVNGAVVSPMSPLVSQIPTTVSRLSPVSRAIAEGVESGAFCAAKDITLSHSIHGEAAAHAADAIRAGKPSIFDDR